MERNYREQDNDLIFALDIGTRSIIGVLGRMEEGRLRVLAIESEEHEKRAMIDGQIEDIAQVARVARKVTDRLEDRMQMRLTRVCVAAAGRALQTTAAHFELKLPKLRTVDEELISQLEAGAVSAAEKELAQSNEDERQYFMVGYSVSQYRLDHYPMSTLLDHKGKVLEADIVGTFLPSEVVESLYSAMRAADLEIVSLTLEPIAAMNAAIPAELRLLNLVLADIGAGTSDIAVCRDGSVVGYTMATLAGDEITETLMRELLVDFRTAEKLKQSMDTEGTITFHDILGMEQQTDAEQLAKAVQGSAETMAEEIARKIVEVNGGAPSALFLSGGGSKLGGLRDIMAKYMNMDSRRIAVVGGNFEKTAFSQEYDLNNPEYATPLGIAVSAGMGLINDSYVVMLNGQPAKLFRNGSLTVQEILLMNGYTYADMLGRTGESLTVTINGQKKVFRGKPATPAVLRCNGKEASVTSVVYAGDALEFTPASNGAGALRTLRDLLGSDFGDKILLNGALCDLDTQLHNGDTISTVLTSGAAAKEERTEETKKEDKEVFFAYRPERETATARTEEAETKTEASVSAASEPEPAVSAAPAVRAVSEEETAHEAAPIVVKKSAAISVVLNGKKLLLQGKENGAPYYLMDLLQYSGIDFDHLERPVTLTINGASGMFQQVIHGGDQIEIRYQ